MIKHYNIIHRYRY